VIQGEPPKDASATGAICCVEVQLDESDVPVGFPDHLISRDLLGSMAIWPYPEFNSFVWWSSAGAGSPTSYDALSAKTREFGVELDTFKGFTEFDFRVGDLLDNPKWEWGYSHGVYCFVRNREAVYVGRALGSTLGQRIWNQLQSQDEQAWKQVVTDRGTHVRVFAVEDNCVYMASALEAFLIDELKPHFNSRKQ